MKKIIGPAVFSVMAVYFLPAMVFGWPVPDTGQTKCYNNTVEISCPAEGEAFYGQDSSYTINPMSYTKLDASGNDLPDDAVSWTMVRDNVTGLIWEDKQDKDDAPNYANPHDADNTYTWYDSNPATNGGNEGTPGDATDTEDFINALNDNNFGGQHDWRLPTHRELVSLINYNFLFLDPRPKINNTYFPNTERMCWSSTTDALNTGAAWVVYFDNTEGGSPVGKLYNGHARAVRGKQKGSLDHLVINGDGTVTDMVTGLMWEKNTPNYYMAWDQALNYCKNLNLAGHQDWRLPTIKELRSILDYNRFYPAIDLTYFPNNSSNSRYWSSTTSDFGTNLAWIMYFWESGTCADIGKSSPCDVRAVRSGQAGPNGHWIILSPKQTSVWNIGALMPIRWNTTGLGINVKIYLSRQGGLSGIFETLIASTPNDGQFDWTITGVESVNCVIKIEQADNPTNWATEGLFVIRNQLDPSRATVQKLFIGYYLRPAAPAGLVYWAGKWAEEEANPDGDIKNVIEAFANTPESQTIWGGITEANIEEFINKAFQSLFGRNAAPYGLNFYHTGFTNGTFTPGTIVYDIFVGAPEGSHDKAVLDKKLAFANAFTLILEPVPDDDSLNDQATYKGQADAAIARDMQAAVGEYTVIDPAAIKQQIKDQIADPGDPILSP